MDRHSPDLPHWKILSALLIAVGCWSCSQGDQEIRLTGQGLRMKGRLHKLYIPKDSLVFESIAAVDLSKDASFSPGRRLWGIGQPRIQTKRFQLDEYLEGWFTLRNKEVAFVLLSEHQGAVYVQTRMTPPSHIKVLSSIGKDVRDSTFSLLVGSDNASALAGRLQSLQ